MSWKDDVHLVPSNNGDVLRRLIGRRIVGLRHYAEESPEELLANDAYTMRNATPSQIFSTADGPVLLTLDDATEVAFSGSEELASIVVESAAQATLDSEWAHQVEATNPTYSEPRFGRAIGRAIVGLRILQRDVDQKANGPTRFASPKLLDRPREAGLVLELDDGTALVFSNGLLDAPNNFGVFMIEDLPIGDLHFHELSRLP